MHGRRRTHNNLHPRRKRQTQREVNRGETDLDTNGQFRPSRRPCGNPAHNPGCSVSHTGVLVYGHEAAASRLIWLTRDGKESAIVAPPGVYRMPRLSPDGNKVAIANSETQIRNLDVWVIDLL